MMQKETKYEKYLKEKHSKFSTSDEVLDNAVHEATGQSPISKRRLILGEVNEVYDVKIPNKENVIIRISHHSKFNFEQERWAIKKCEKVGVPVPHILLIKHIKTLEKEILQQNLWKHLKLKKNKISLKV